MNGHYATSIKMIGIVMFLVAAAAFIQTNSYAADASSDDLQLYLDRPDTAQEREDRKYDLEGK